MNYWLYDENNNPNRTYWNLVKGLGVISVVVGHCWMWAQNFVYLYHVPLFFFISGYMYREDKYGDDPFLNLEGRMHSWIKYIVYYVFFILGHNLFYQMDMLRLEEPSYTIREMVEKCGNVLIGCGDELLAGPLWFVPVLVFSSVFMGFIIYFSRKIRAVCHRNFWKFAFQAVAVVICSIAGYMMILRGVKLPANMQIAFAVLPYLWIGYLLRNYVKNLQNYFHPVAAFILLISLLLFARHNLISLVDGYLHPLMYLVAFTGFYIVMTVAKMLYQQGTTAVLSGIVAYFGAESYWLMAAHFTVIRSIDRIYAGWSGNIEMMYEHYLGSVNALVPVYLLLGLGIPTILYYIWHRIEKKVIR